MLSAINTHLPQVPTKIPRKLNLMTDYQIFMTVQMYKLIDTLPYNIEYNYQRFILEHMFNMKTLQGYKQNKALC